MQNNGNKVPEVSIDEALDLYLAMAFPQGLPEGEQGEKIREIFLNKIVKDRPEWAEASHINTGSDEEPTRYSELKAKITKEANKEEIPEDPEERYLYLRRKDAKANREQKQAEEKEVSQEKAFRQGLIDDKRALDQETLNRAALIKNAILQRKNQRLSPSFESTMSLNGESPTLEKRLESSEVETANDELDFSTQKAIEAWKSRSFTDEKIKTKTKPDAKEWFNDFDTLSTDDRAKSIKEYNSRKREMLQTREELMWSRSPRPKEDYGFTLRDDGFGPNSGLGFESDKKLSNGFSID